MARASWAAANAAAVPGPQDEVVESKFHVCHVCRFCCNGTGSTETKVESFRSRFSSCIVWDSITLPCGIQMQCLHIHPHYLSSSRLILKKLQAQKTWKNPSLLLGCIIESSNKPAWHRYEFCPRRWIPPASASGVGKRTSIPWHQKTDCKCRNKPRMERKYYICSICIL